MNLTFGDAFTIRGKQTKLTVKIPKYQFEISAEGNNPKVIVDIIVYGLELFARNLPKKF